MKRLKNLFRFFQLMRLRAHVIESAIAWHNQLNTATATELNNAVARYLRFERGLD